MRFLENVKFVLYINPPVEGILFRIEVLVIRVHVVVDLILAKVPVVLGAQDDLVRFEQLFTDLDFPPERFRAADILVHDTR